MKLKTKLNVGQRITLNNAKWVVEEIRIMVNPEINISYLIKNLKNDKWMDLEERSLEDE